jgi:carboxyl-terminal processing protease
MRESPKSLRRLVLSLALSVGAGGLCMSLAAPRLWAQEKAVAEAAQPQLAAADLRSKAYEAVKKGQFDQTYELLSRAASLTHDPKDQKLVEWAKGFNEQITKFTAERRKEYDKAVAKIKLLREHGKLAYAMDFASGAQYLADNKEAFLKEPWLVELMAEAQKRAAEHDRGGEWVRAFRLYSQLAAIDGDKPEWKEKFKTSTRRLRILSLYTPDQVRKLYKEDGKERDEVEAMLKELDAKLNAANGNGEPVVKLPATKPATKPAEDEEQDRQNRVDWKKALEGVRTDMLTEALGLARQNYYKQVEFRTVLAGGLEGLKVLVTTPALRETFPGIADDAARNNFLGALEARLAELNQPNAQEEIRTLLRDVAKWNDDTIKLPENVWVAEFADGAFGALDPFSTVIWPYGMDELTKTVRGEFSGVGIQIRVDDAGNLKVVTPIEDSPAYKARIKPDSVITEIDGNSARWISIDEAVKRITGAPGSFVTLTIKDSKGNITKHTLKRQTLKVDTVRGWKHRVEAGGVARGWDFFIDPQEKIGYIRVSQFTRSTLSDIDRAMTEMRTAGGEVRGVILDLRHNPGGLLSSAVEVVDKFIDQGLIVRTAPAREDSPNGEQQFKAKAQDADIRELPVIVLVNQISASASEIVSGALKDHKRALIVGERTYGKGSVQIVSQLIGSNASLKITTSHYYLPNGKCIHREENAKEWGVDPDVTVEMTPEQIRAAIEVRQELDVLRDEDPLPAQGEKLPEKAEKVADAVEAAKKNRDPLSVDAQLSAALFLMRLELNQQRPG